MVPIAIDELEEQTVDEFQVNLVERYPECVKIIKNYIKNQ